MVDQGPSPPEPQRPPKPLSGRPVPPPAVKVFDCPNCGAGVTVHALGHTVSAACHSCGSIIDITNENFQILTKAANAIKLQPLIPLGQKGKLKGQVWQCIGMMQRDDPSSPFSWREYLLFNPMQGYRWLVEADGHWSYVVRLTETPKLGWGARARALGKSYRLYNDGKARVNFVIGEFYWRVKVGETVRAVDYVLPPEMLSLEESKDEVIWSVGEYMEPEVVQAAFLITAPMPHKIGVAPNQPSPTKGPASSAVGWAMSFGLFLSIAQFLIIIYSKGEQVVTESYFHNPAVPKTQVTPSFKVSGLANLQISLFSPVSNSWFETSVDLVNDKTGDAEPLDIGVEYYFGWDSDGSWREGSQWSSKIISSVQEGTYHLEIQPNSEGTPLPQVAPSVIPAQIRRETYPNGALKAEEPYVNGVIEGNASYYYPNGKLTAQIPYRGGKKHGVFTLYRDDGSKEQDLSYKDGELHGTIRWYNPDGSMKGAAQYRAGKYDPVAKPLEMTYTISVRHDVPTWSNFLWAMFLVSIYPLWMMWRKRSFEMARWSNSDYSPYRSSG
jgi:hypothetical protein